MAQRNYDKQYIRDGHCTTPRLVSEVAEISLNAAYDRVIKWKRSPWLEDDWLYLPRGKAGDYRFRNREYDDSPIPEHLLPIMAEGNTREEARKIYAIPSVTDRELAYLPVHKEKDYGEINVE